MTAIAELARDVGVSDRTLRRAINLGTIRASRPTERTLELSAGERSYVRRQWPLIAKIREVLRTEQNVRQAVLFGSAARGDDRDRSDIDIAVVLRDESFSRLVDLNLKLEQILGCPVDVVRLTDAAANPRLDAEIQIDGRPLIDRQ